MHGKHEENAQSCARCGHIRGASERSDRCGRCGVHPVTWTSAPIEDVVDEEVAAPLDPTIADEVAAYRDSNESGPHTQDLFATAPAGVEGYDVNPELRVRR